MSDKKLDFEDGLGDIDSILHNQSVSDLSWLAVDEAAYRASEALPKQNLDMIPELTHALAYSPEDDVPHVIPLKPHVMVNRNPLDSHESSKMDLTTPIRNRVAKYVMEGLKNSEIKEKLTLEYSPVDIRNASEAISEVLNESGLLGNVYIDARHFPKCAQIELKDKKLITACAKNALYVLSKSECSRCVKNVSGRCASLQKELVDEIPYGSTLAAHYAPKLVSERRASYLTDDTKNWKEKLRFSFLSKPLHINPDGIQKAAYQAVQSAPEVSESDIKNYIDRTNGIQQNAVLSSEYKKFSRRMMDRKNDVELLTNASDPTLNHLAGEYGLLGHIYLDMDVLGGCKNTIDFINKSSVASKYLVRRSASCGVCKNTSDGGCALLCKTHKILSSVPVYSKEDFVESLEKAVEEHRVSSDDMRKASLKLAGNYDWKSLISQVNLYSIKRAKETYKHTSYKAFYGSDVPKEALSEESFRRFISHLMNTGLSGTALKNAVLNRYDISDLKPFKSVGTRLASEESIQGSYYLDPTAYSDYGMGCSEGSSLFKNKGPKNILASDKCTGCTLQLSSGWCSRYAKNIVRHVPEHVREASKRVSLPVYREPVENPVEKYELASEPTIDLRGTKLHDLDISFDNVGFDD